MARSTPRQTRRNIVTLEDLAPRRDVVGGSASRVFGAEPAATREEHMAVTKKAAKDLPASKSVKGGGKTWNDNLTLVRAAKPSKRDLPPNKDIKAGKKAL
jgi:hypothetical protein